MESIDVTPTWTAVLPILVEAAANGETPEGRDAAWTELRRLAAIADETLPRLQEALVAIRTIRPKDNYGRTSYRTAFASAQKLAAVGFADVR